MNFELYPLRFCFRAQDSLYFPAGKTGNILRGAFGTILKKIACATDYARIFEPASTGAGPSGLTDWPRPFVFRASHLDGLTIAPDQPFHFDLNLFDMRDPAVAYFVLTFSQFARDGLGPNRGRAHLVSVWKLDGAGEPRAQIHDGSRFLMTNAGPPLSLPLSAGSETVHAIRVEFTTPTELKSGHELAARPEFAILFARVRDRISTLRALYGPGPLEIDFKAMGERSILVQMTQCALRQVEASRRSTRTNQTHSLSGFIGWADYQGELTEFVPYLEAACWTGVGRQTVWGKGAIRVIRYSESMSLSDELRRMK